MASSKSFEDSSNNETPPTEENTPNNKQADTRQKNQQFSNQPSNTKPKSQCNISAAIDFGTSGCAVAYSYASEKDKVIVIDNWKDGVSTHGKIPTAILFDENKKFLAFGNLAIEKYMEFAADEDHGKCYFFQNFKKELHKKEVSFL